MTSAHTPDRRELAKTMEEVKRLAASGRYSEARTLCTAAMERFPEEADLYFRRGMIQNVLKESQAAVEDLSRAIELRSDEPAFPFFRGLWRLELGMNDSAIVDLSQAIRLEEALDASYYVDSARLARAVAYMLNGETDQALISISGLPDHAGVFVAKRAWSTSMLKEELRKRRGPG